MTKRDGERAGLVAEIEHWDTQLATWRDRSQDAEEERDLIRSRIGEAVLAEPGRADELVDKLGRCDATIEVCAKTEEAALPKLDAARRAVLEFDAAVFDDLAEGAREKLIVHEARTAKILQMLVDHEGEGEFVPVGALDHAAYVGSLPAGMTGTFINTQAKPWGSWGLQAEVTRFEAKAQYLRDVVAGIDPDINLNKHKASDGGILGELATDFYPRAVWGPEAIIATSLYLRRVDSVRSALAQHDADASVDIEPKVAELEGRIRKLRKEIAGRQFNRTPLPDDDEQLEGWGWLIRKLRTDLQEAPAKRAQLVAQLEALTGDRETVGV